MNRKALLEISKTNRVAESDTKDRVVTQSV